MQLLVVDGLIGDLGGLDGGVELGVAVLTVVVAVAGGEQLQHVGSVVVVHDPTVTADVVVTGAAQGQEAGPVDLVDVHGDAQLTPGLLQVLRNGDVVAGVVGAVGDGGEAFAVGVTGLSQQALGLLQVGLVVLADVGLAAVGVVDEHGAFLSIHDAGADDVVGGAVGALHDDVGHVVAVDGQAQSLAHAHIGERLTLVVQADVVGAQDAVHVEVAAVLGLGQAGDLIGGNVLDQLGLTAVVSGVGSAGVLQEQEGDVVRDDLAGIPAANVVGVLGEHDALAGGPVGDHVRTVADEGVGAGAPAVAVGLNGGFLHGRQSGESSQLVKVGAGVAQGNSQGLAVLAGDDLQGVGVGIGGGVAVGVRIALGLVEAGDHAHSGRGVGSGGVGIRHTLEAVLEVLGGQVRAIAPLQAVTHGEGPGQAVRADFVALCLAGDDIVVLIDQQQGLENGDDGVGTVNGAVQRGVQGLRVRSVLDGESGTGRGGFGSGFCSSTLSALGSGSAAGAGGGTAGSQRCSHAAGNRHSDKFLHLHVVFPPM